MPLFPAVPVLQFWSQLRESKSGYKFLLANLPFEHVSVAAFVEEKHCCPQLTLLALKNVTLVPSTTDRPSGRLHDEHAAVSEQPDILYCFFKASVVTVPSEFLTTPLSH
jgi:hypothetical protein